MMEPNFALDLSSDGLALLHRAGGGRWHAVGEVAFGGGDLAGDLAALRYKALALDPSGMATRLIIPDEQIRYLDIPAASAPHGDHDAAAAAALDGATPYALEELAYDWVLSGTRLQIAAVARETLEEAEAFATEHGFNPVSFVAQPDAAVFAGEPFFGPTALAEAAGMFARDDAPPGDPAEADPWADPALRDASAHETGTGAEIAAAAETGLLFSTIRAERGPARPSAPRLEGVARFTPAPPIPAAELRALSGGASASLAPRAVEPEEADAEEEATTQPARDSLPDSRSRESAHPFARPAIPAPRDEAERLTIFGARTTEAAQRGRPRFLGLVLTAVLVLLLIGVGALAAIFPETGLGRLLRGSEPEIAVTPDIPELAVAEPESAAPDPDPVSSAIPPEPAAAPPSVPAAPEPALPAAEPEQDLDIASLPEPEAMPRPEATPVATPPVWQPPRTPEEARARYAATGIWPTAPAPPPEPPSGTLESFYQTSIDSGLALGDAIALPDPATLRADAPPPAPGLPPPPGRVFAFDARGLVVATPGGVRTPEGVLVRAGPPPVRPETMPVRAVPVPGLEPTPEARAARERLSGIRPRTRPGDLREQQERGALGGRSRSELAALRPRTRPAGLVASAPAAAPDTAAIDAALAEATEQAVAASLKPRLRPQSLAPAPRQEPRQDRAEPTSTAAAAPSIPSSASIARQATTRNAINLRQVNLIGVYGTPSNRRALVRLANGRYQKVQVGDRIDGGRVSAIGDTELRYNKSGRDVVLRMPKG